MAFGFSLENIVLPFLFIIAPFLSLIIPVSLLFGTMIGFMRLSADNEFTVLLSSGMSLKRIFLPTLLVALFTFLITFLASISLEAWGRREFDRFVFRKTKTEIDNIIRLKVQEGAFIDDFLGYIFYTEKIAKDRVHYERVLIAPSRDSKESDFVLTAAYAEIQGSVKDGFLNLNLYDGTSYSFNEVTREVSMMRFEKAGINLLSAFREKVFGAIDEDYRSYQIFKLHHFVQDLQKNPTTHNNGVFLRSRYLLHSRLANPMVVFVFAILGMVLGVHEARQPKKWSYFLAIFTTIAALVTTVCFRWLAEQGYMHGILAAWLPQGIFLVVAAFFFAQKNRLPISENILSLRNFPFMRR